MIAFALLFFAAQFTDVAADAGLRFVHQNSPTPSKHLIETMPGGIAVFDYDGDGLIDIFFTNGASVPDLKKSSTEFSNRLFRNEGKMKFRDVTERSGLAGEGYSMGASVGDFDNDGKPDLFVAGVFRNLLYRNRGDGTFENVTSKSGIRADVWSVAGAWLDYDNDGRLDLFVVNYAKWTPEFDKFCGDEQRKIRVYCHPRLFEGFPNTLYRNNGDGTFEDVSKQSGILAHKGKGMSASIADYDADGFLDIFVPNDKLPNFLFRNLGGRGFEETALLAGAALPEHGKAVSGMGADFRDYDNDARPDIVFTALNGELFPLLRNTGGGQFTDVTHETKLAALSTNASGWGTGLYDFDNDGRKDLFAAGSHVNDHIESSESAKYKQPNLLFWNRPGGFALQSLGEPRAHRGSAVADFDGDGKLDIVVSALGEPAELWRNNGPARRWLMVKLEGTKSNRDGVGAVLRVGDQTNHMTTAVGYASSSHAGVHFGLGDAAITDVEVRSPSGVVQRLEKVKADQVLVVRER